MASIILAAAGTAIGGSVGGSTLGVSAAAIGGAQAQFPGYEFTPTGTAEGHHNVVRFTWDLVSRADGSAPAAGFDVITLAEDGRISTVTGFLDRLPG